MPSDTGTIEIGAQIHSFSPHIEYFGTGNGIDAGTPFPSDFRQRFQKLSETIYPQTPIQRMKDDGYNPVIIGYAHTGRTDEIEAIKRKLVELKQQNPQLRALQEIDPKQLQWIKEFLEMEAEYKEKGTIGGRPARPDEPQRMQDYRRKLQGNNAEHLSLWYLDNGINVGSIEHPDIRNWIETDKAQGLWGDEEESFGFTKSSDLQPFHTAIKRDIYGLRVIDKERPDVVTVGSMHALKYDMLLGRGGQRSFYYLDAPFDWDMILKQWEDVHRRIAPTQEVV